MNEQFLLGNMPTSEYRVTIDEDHITLSQTLLFTFDAASKQDLTWFLQAVKQDKAVRHTFAGEGYILDYDPAREDLHLFQITRRRTKRVISMGWSTAGRLRLALEGDTDHLVKEQ